MRTLEEACELAGVAKTEFGLNLHFSPIPNWYMRMGVDCPICDNPIDWEWNWGKNGKPQITTDITPQLARPVVNGAEMIDYGHRWLRMQCKKCHTQLFAENFD